MEWHVGDEAQMGLWPLVTTDGIRMGIAGLIKTQAVAIRIADLLNRHGLEDCTLESMVAALDDLHERAPYLDDIPEWDGHGKSSPNWT